MEGAIMRVLGALLLGTTATLVLFLQLVDGTWDSWEPAQCLSFSTGCFCEKPRPGLVRQPANTWSNLGYTLTGVATLVQGWELMASRRRRREEHHLAGAASPAARRTGPARSTKTYGLEFESPSFEDLAEEDLNTAAIVAFGLSNVALGIGSIFLHASLTLWGQFIDNVGMYLLILAFMFHSRHSIRIARWREAAAKEKSRQPMWLPVAHQYALEFVVGSTVTVQVMYASTHIVRSIFFPSLLIATLMYELQARRVCGARRCAGNNSRIIVRCVLALLAGAVLWILDNNHILCEPESILQGHAAWHFLTAASSYLLFCYLWSIAASSDEGAAQPSGTRHCKVLRVSLGFQVEYEVV